MFDRYVFTEKHLVAIRDYPHLLGHIAGKTKLSDIHSSWILRTWGVPERHTGILAHRGSYKTTALAVGVGWWLLFHPNDRIAIVRKTYSQALQTVAMISQFFEVPEIQALFYYAHGVLPKKIIDRAGSVTFAFKKTATIEGSITGFGLDSNLTGSHFDRMWLDDVVTLKDRVSRAAREWTKEIVREIITNIIDPGKGIIFTGTPWHKKDARLVLPFKLARFSIDDCQILTPDEIEEKRRTTTPSLFALNYKLDDTDESDIIFPEPEYRIWDFADLGPVYAHIDVAYEGADTNALTFMAARKEFDRHYMGAGFSYSGSIKDWVDTVVQLYVKYRTTVIFVETNTDKGYAAELLRKRGLVVSTYHEDMNKTFKMESYLGLAWRRIVWDENTDPEYIEQYIDYRPHGAPDDALDSGASLLRHAFPDEGVDPKTGVSNSNMEALSTW